MIRRVSIRRIPTPEDLLDRVLAPLGLAGPEAEDNEEESLQVLLKHAFRANPAESAASQVLQRLTRLVRGPFGTALEGPTQSSLEVELLTSGGWSDPIPFAAPIDTRKRGLPFARGRESVWNLVRFDQVSLPPRVCSALLT